MRAEEGGGGGAEDRSCDHGGGGEWGAVVIESLKLDAVWDSFAVVLL